MFKSESYKKTYQKVVKTEGHSNSAAVLIRLKASKERNYLVDTSKAYS